MNWIFNEDVDDFVLLLVVGFLFVFHRWSGREQDGSVRGRANFSMRVDGCSFGVLTAPSSILVPAGWLADDSSPSTVCVTRVCRYPPSHRLFVSPSVVCLAVDGSVGSSSSSFREHSPVRQAT